MANVSQKGSILSNNRKKTFWEALHWLFCDPKRLIRVVVLTTCTFIVVFQLGKCIKKLVHPPITTHTQFELNQTLRYPAVTLCRNPGYKEDVLEKYNLDKHPIIHSPWDDFPFENYTMEEMFNDATYNINDYFTTGSNFSGLDGKRENIAIKSSMHFVYGQCQTIQPLVETRHAGRSSGYQIHLQHDLDLHDEFYSIENPPPHPGWHVFIHDANEEFIENRIYASGRIEYLYVNVRENIEIKLQTQHLTKIPSVEKPCSNNPKLSSIKCKGVCNWKGVAEKVNCSGPWMPDINYQECSDANSTQTLISTYMHDDMSREDNCDCMEPCCSIIFSAYVMSRQDIDDGDGYGEGGKEPGEFYAYVFIYYSTNVVSVIEEKLGYDLTQFVADMGGSIGFLLGLSVIGLIAALENILALVCLQRLPTDENEKNLTSGKPLVDEDNDSIFIVPCQENEGEVFHEKF